MTECQEGIKRLFCLTQTHYNCRVRVIKHVVLLYTLSFLIVLPYLCHDMPQTWYYALCTNTNTTEKNLLRENDLRIAQASNILNELDDLGYDELHQRLMNDSRSAVSIAMTVMTISRNQLVKDDVYSPKYLTQVIANLLNIVRKYKNHSDHLHINISLCNGDRKPWTHTEAIYLSKYVPMFTESPGYGANLHVKEIMKRGYVYCLKQMLAMETDFVLLAEDDAVPYADLMPVLDMVVSRYFTTPGNHVKPVVSSTRIDKTAFVKFHHPERLLSFIGLDAERIPELLSFSICLSCVLTVLYYIGDYNKRIHIVFNIRWLWCIFFIFSVLVCLCVGRTNLIEFHRMFPPYLFYLTRSPSCCTQAILYPRKHLALIMSELDKVRCNKTYASDDALDDIVERQGLYSYLVQPNLFKNIGMYSALRKVKISPYLIA